MSGIAGIYRFDGNRVEESLLLRMRQAGVHRGPDGSGFWVGTRAGLVHLLLRNSLESLHEKQPFTNGHGLWIVADCRIDNREELRQEFESHGLWRYESNCPDAVFILSAYERWAEESPSHLLGDFAFAIWDERRQKLFCARDPMGLKPFFYHWDGKKFLFGSEMKQIFQDPAVPREIHLPHLAEMMINCFPSREETPYQAIRRLPPAHSIRIEKDFFEIRKYWDWDPDAESISSRPLEENAAIFRDLFQEAVHARLRVPATYRAGSLLSGGLDSSSIVALAASGRRDANSRADPFPVFTLCFPEANPAYQSKKMDSVDESPYWKPLVEKYKLDSHQVVIEGWGPLRNYEQTLFYQETVPFFPTLAYFQYLFETAGTKRVRVLLDGSGGDELFGVGSQCFLWNLKRGHFVAFYKECQQRRRNRGTSFQSILSGLVRSLIPEPFKVPYRRLIRKVVPNWIDPAFAKKIRLRDRVEKDFRWDSSVHTSSSEGIICLLRAGMPISSFEMVEKAAAAAQMEIRLPYLDVRLLRFMASVPSNQKMKEGISKIILRKAMKDFLPVEIYNRPRKTEFTPVIRSAFERYAQEAMAAVVEEPHPIVRSMVLTEKVKNLRLGKGLETLMFLWYLMSVDQWLKHQAIFWKKLEEVHYVARTESVLGE